MKKVLLTTLVCCLLCTCTSQSKKKSDGANDDPSIITSENFVQQVTDSVKHYPKEPMYYIFVHNYYCYYEILVNDYPVYKFFSEGSLATPIFLNAAILKSGEQKLTYRMYPLEDVFLDETKLNLTMEVMDDRIGFDSSKDILQHRSAYNIKMVGTDKDIEREVFAAAGKKYYEHTITFNANVPYQNQGWLGGQDLRKLNRDSLYQAVLDYYKDYRTIYDNKDADKLAQVLFRTTIEFSQSEYTKKEDIQASWDDDLQMLNIEKEFLPMDNIKMSFYGDGRMVCLEQAETEDLRLRNKSAFYFKYKSGKHTIGRYTGLYLYLPKGKKDLRELEMAI